MRRTCSTIVKSPTIVTSQGQGEELHKNGPAKAGPFLRLPLHIPALNAADSAASSELRRHARRWSVSVARFRVRISLLLLTFAGSPIGYAWADGVPAPSLGAAAILTHFESFVLTGCAPCVRETFPIATIQVPATKIPAFPGNISPNTGTTRSGKIGLELLRAYPLGRESQQHFAMRITLSIRIGEQDQTYPTGVGLLDEADVAALAATVFGIADAALSVPQRSPADVIDLEFHGDTIRVGVVRVRDESVAYVQAWSSTDVPRLALKQVWEVPSLYFPGDNLSVLGRAIEQVSAKIRQMRGP
jgi:hypothetical protein